METTENNPTVLDAPDRVAEKPTIKEMILWWEKRRAIFIFFLVAFMVYFIYSHWNYPMRSILGTQAVLWESVLFFVFANLAYYAGWGLEVGLYLIVGKGGMSNPIKWLLFILGTLLTIFVCNIHYVLLFDALFFDPVPTSGTV